MAFFVVTSFAENITGWTVTDKKICGKHRLEIAIKTPPAAIAPRVKCSTKLLLGSKEVVRWPDMKRTFDRAERLLPNVQSKVIDGVGHDVVDPLYGAAIRDMLSRSGA